MTRGLRPTETVDNRLTVVVLSDSSGRTQHHCNSYSAAIATTKEHLAADTVVKIENRDDEVVFTSAEMDIEAWEVEWKNAKRRLSVDVPEHDCPYDTISCFADDLCTRCQIDRVQEES